MWLLIGLALAVFIIADFIIPAIQRRQYEQSEYFEQTGTPYKTVNNDKGLLGEYCIYKYLRPLEGERKFLFNCYLPKDDNETTELDVILIHESGIYVFESKNYSGWIFGTETDRYWTQTLPAGKGKSHKSRFFNPIMQNKLHLKWLENYLGEDESLLMSYIVFSDRCTLKDINLTSGNHRVINRYDILPELRRRSGELGKRLSVERIEEIYNKLLPMTKVDEAKKAEHIENIKKKHPPVPQGSHKNDG